MEKQQNLQKRLVRILFLLDCFKGITFFVTKNKSGCKPCNIRLVQQDNIRTHMQKPRSLWKRVVRILFLLDCFKGISHCMTKYHSKCKWCYVSYIQNHYMQYHIRQKAQPEDTHWEATKPPQKSGQHIVPPRLFQRYLFPYVTNENPY